MADDQTTMLIPGVVPHDEESRAKVREKQLANLVPFQPGMSGNPNGRRPGGAYVQEHINAFLMVDEDGHPRYSRADLEIIAEDPQSAPAAVAAARQVLLMMKDPQKWVRDKHGEVYQAGSDPEVGKAFDRVMDRLIGKPMIHTTLHDDPSRERTPSEIQGRIMAMLAANPALREYMAQRLVEQLEGNPGLRDYLLSVLPSDAPREIVDERPEA